MSRVENKWFSKCGSRLSAAHTRLKHVQRLHGWRTAPFQHVALALTPRTFVLKIVRASRV
eukprot:7491797-Pyramimonas_sp.AAC.1